MERWPRQDCSLTGAGDSGSHSEGIYGEVEQWTNIVSNYRIFKIRRELGNIRNALFVSTNNNFTVLVHTLKLINIMQTSKILRYFPWHFPRPFVSSVLFIVLKLSIVFDSTVSDAPSRLNVTRWAAAAFSRSEIDRPRSSTPYIRHPLPPATPHLVHYYSRYPKQTRQQINTAMDTTRRDALAPPARTFPASRVAFWRIEVTNAHYKNKVHQRGLSACNLMLSNRSPN